MRSKQHPAGGAAPAVPASRPRHAVRGRGREAGLPGQVWRVRFTGARAGDCAHCGQRQAQVVELVTATGESRGRAVVCSRCQLEPRHRGPADATLTLPAATQPDTAH